MKTVIITALTAASVFVLADSADDLRPPVFHVPDKWELLHEASVKLRNTLTEFDKKLKGLVINDNAVHGQIIANKVDDIYLVCMAIMDKMDAEIEAKILTRDAFEKFFTDIHDSYHYSIITIWDELKYISLRTQKLYLDAQVEATVALRTHAVSFRVLLIEK